MNRRSAKKRWKGIFELLPPRQKLGFLFILIILMISAVLSQLTPLAIGYMTDTVLAGGGCVIQVSYPHTYRYFVYKCYK